MTADDRWLAKIECPRCGQRGTVACTQADGWSFKNHPETHYGATTGGFRLGVSHIERPNDPTPISCSVCGHRFDW
jgi:transcription elongation factor Elf1